MIFVSNVPLQKQVADVFIKGLPGSSFEVLIDKLGIINIYTLAREMLKDNNKNYGQIHQIWTDSMSGLTLFLILCN